MSQMLPELKGYECTRMISCDLDIRSFVASDLLPPHAQCFQVSRGYGTDSRHGVWQAYEHMQRELSLELKGV